MSSKGQREILLHADYGTAWVYSFGDQTEYLAAITDPKLLDTRRPLGKEWTSEGRIQYHRETYPSLSLYLTNDPTDFGRWWQEMRIVEVDTNRYFGVIEYDGSESFYYLDDLDLFRLPKVRE